LKKLDNISDGYPPLKRSCGLPAVAKSTQAVQRTQARSFLLPSAFPVTILQRDLITFNQTKTHQATRATLPKFL